MAGPTAMMLYICPNCNLLLMKIEKKYATYHRAVLHKDGWYVDMGYDNDNESDFDYYVCPLCGLHADEDDGDHLKSITLPVSVAEQLIKLWEDFRGSDKNYTGDYDHGLPMDTDGLKEILVEGLL